MKMEVAVRGDESELPRERVERESSLWCSCEEMKGREREMSVGLRGKGK